ncbi:MULTISPECIES: ABC transporter substrate-binding protein [Gammaproteobacteria]|uniref:substrate-binding periplasmic protein n=1 Tax=Gammaproteobacteria TaxID=1236 RepID=UPI000DD06B7A|nr:MULTISPECIES: transporter substrate-binding domain-containing protein [Gammaproteobacteria]RTE85592.1 transporter substrate-binding domain-containing protein [Aliidiomarina sp. B3213]TCZ89562.1 transporter substrate-binding domain-containing protein [Lysobacter sp. N42]
MVQAAARYTALTLAFVTWLSISPVAASSLHVLVGLHKPPYIDLTSNSGYEIELMELIGAHMGVHVNFTHVPNGRIGETLSADAFDASSLQKEETGPNDYYYSCPYIQYQNMVVTRQQDRLTINSLEDLLGLSVLAFQTANIVLGEDFSNAIERAEDYNETVDQSAQVEMLLRGRVQAIVIDRNILNHYLLTSDNPSPLNRLTIATTNYQVAFKDPNLRDRFNEAQSQVWQTPEYQELQQKYFGDINQNLEMFCEV